MPHIIPLLLLATAGEPQVGTGPQPSPVAVSWEFAFKFEDPKRIEVRLPGQERPEVYWYMLYTVTNTGERSQHFFPIFQLHTQNFQVIDTDKGIHPLVFAAIRERHRQLYPYLVEPEKAIGDLLVGDDHARESVAIWRQVDLSNGSFAVYVAGLSGETRFLHNPAFDPSQPESSGNPKNFVLRKTLEIRYNLPGSPSARPQTTPERRVTRWIMR